MQLTFLVEEKSDTYKFEVDKRSDGFKQFVSIILNLSIEKILFLACYIQIL
jgi:hypothetical protein